MYSMLMEKRGAALVLVLSALAGCGGGETAGGGEAGAPAGGAAAAPAASPVDAATAGNVAGRVTFSGTAPSMAAIDMASEAACSSKHPTPPTEESVMVGADGALANVFVYVKTGLEALTFPVPTQPVVLDQNGCVYHPHVLGVQVGQNVTIRNSDGILHNIKAAPTANRPFNISQPVNMDTERSFPTAEVMIPVQCNVHGWMTMYLGVLPHPYYAVSAADGSVSLPGLPPGEYVIEAWHERFGTQTQTVTVTTGQTAQVAFTFSAAAATAVPLGEPVDLLHPEGHATVASR